jgi:hypothetical protein
MFRNYLAAAWRSAARDRLHSAINILGLAIGLAATILIALYLRNELSYDDFLEGRSDVYRVSSEMRSPDREMTRYSTVPEHTAAALALDFPEMAPSHASIPSGWAFDRGGSKLPSRSIGAIPRFCRCWASGRWPAAMRRRRWPRPTRWY